MSTTPFQPVAWDLEPGRTALVIIDPQNDFLHNEGHYAKKGVDISHMRRTIEPTKALVAEAREQRHPGDLDPPRLPRPGGRRLDRRRCAPSSRTAACARTPGARRCSTELGHARRGPLRRARTASAPSTRATSSCCCTRRTPLTVIFAGVLTNQCVAATSKDAMFRDFKPIVVEEAIGTTLPHLHAPALEMMQVGWAEVRNLEDTLAGMRALSPAAVA